MAMQTHVSLMVAAAPAKTTQRHRPASVALRMIEKTATGSKYGRCIFLQEYHILPYFTNLYI